MIAMPKKKLHGRVERQVFKMFVHRWPKLHMKSNSCLSSCLSCCNGCGRETNKVANNMQLKKIGTNVGHKMSETWHIYCFRIYIYMYKLIQTLHASK